eukprot:CAMPEP_0176240946 /NCGR_PEP_ID=MMETSP0121_2-20121125/29636_1 /TAXON_ID=160619 /ORGANISM="Kryptoperidinium foliaceum, Strain CCMP 1326" /LENGTH=203 /DNA_ID=CAMNT_0017580455 /DNA_START=87 /DNA_END=694 /DNA_ORIENTATION=-
MQLRCHMCKKAVRLGDKKHHFEADCSHRPIACPLCDSQVTPATLQEHQMDSCSRRIVPCPECQAEVTASELDAHQVESCAHRMVKCQVCQEQVQLSDMQAHMEKRAGMHISSLLCENGALHIEVQSLRAAAGAAGGGRESTKDELQRLKRENHPMREPQGIPLTLERLERLKASFRAQANLRKAADLSGARASRLRGHYRQES